MGWSNNITLTNNTDQLLDSGIWGTLHQGLFEIYLYANDTLGNINDTIVLTLYKDTLPPEVIVNLPLPGDDWWNEAPLVNIAYSDMNYDTLWYRSKRFFVERIKHLYTVNVKKVFTDHSAAKDCHKELACEIIWTGPLYLYQDRLCRHSLGGRCSAIGMATGKDIQF